MFDLQGLDHIAITVRDVEASAAWYARVLGLERRHPDVWGDVPTMMGVGETMIALFPVQGDVPKPGPGRDVIAMRHFALRADRANYDKAKAELERRGIDYRFQDHIVSHLIYFHDPDGHQLEITTYELD